MVEWMLSSVLAIIPWNSSQIGVGGWNEDFVFEISNLLHDIARSSLFVSSAGIMKDQARLPVQAGWIY